MAKGDDAIRKKKNKALRKKLQKDSSSAVSTRVASIIAAKKRRQTGKRRQCQGMCFSLPTPEDPFNDRQGKPAEEKKDAKKRKKNDERKRLLVSDEKSTDDRGSKRSKVEELGGNEEQSEDDVVDDVHEEAEVPGGQSKFLVLCLKSIQNALLADDGTNVEDFTPLFVNTWGINFLKCYSAGKNILETSGNSPDLQQIAWMVSAAADSIARKDKEGESFANPFLLYLVSSQERANEVRSVCKPLKALGIHTVSLHPGAPIDHQINGLKSCEPEFLVATPERLWELVTLRAIDISGVSLLVVDGMDLSSESGRVDAVKRISQSTLKASHVVVFKGRSSIKALNIIPATRGPVCKLSPDDSVKDINARILQSVDSYTKGEKRLVR